MNDLQQIVGGDLNLILGVREKKGWVQGNQAPNLYDFIQKNALIDIAPRNGNFTWNDKRNGRDFVMERLHRFLVNED